MRPQHEYRIILRPSVDRLRAAGTLLLTAAEVAEFLGVSSAQVPRLQNSGRIPLPVHLGLGRCPRWSAFELLEWIAEGCPPREEWMELRGWSGWLRWQGRGLLW